MSFSELFRKERPKAISIVGYVFAGFALMMIVSSVMALVMHIIMSNLGDMPDFPGPFNFVFKHYRNLAFGETIGGALLLFVSCSFLLGKNWARIGLQVFLVVSLILTVVFCKLWNDGWSSLAPNDGFRLFGVLVAIGVGVFWGVAYIAGIVFLNRKKVKQFCLKSETN